MQNFLRNIFQFMKSDAKPKKQKYARITISSLPAEIFKILDERRAKTGFTRSNQLKSDISQFYLNTIKNN